MRTQPIAASPMEFGMSFGRSGGPRPEARPFRMLVMGDFSGRSARSVDESARLAERTVHGIDIETMDDVMKRMNVHISIAGQNLPLRSLDDLHPDALYQSLHLFAEGRVLRAKLRVAATAAQAERELDEWLGAPTKIPETPAPQAQPPSTDLMSQLLGGPARVNAPSLASNADAFIRSIMGNTGTVMPASAGALPRLDDRLSLFMRGVLRDPAFREIESSWRGAHWLINRLELSDDLSLHLLDVSAAELAADMAAHPDPRSGGLAKAVASGGVGHEAFHVILSLHTCPPDAASVRLAGWLARALPGALFCGCAHPGLTGCPSFGTHPDADQWTQPISADAREAWQTLCADAGANALVLAAPRIILRQPYGASSDEIDSFRFEEFVPEELGSAAAHEHYLWGGGSLAVGALLGNRFTDSGWDIDPEAGGSVGDLPVHTWNLGGQAQVKPCAEAWLSDRSTTRLVASGLVPVASIRGRDAVLIGTLQTPGGKPPKPAWV
ncbi:MAG: type VI secretion system contractile sheath large subunit [Phycisphaeraceae bacterium]|nr:type VI secretion system contractile sheath large subunit [Phycisphaeraceae bacterium]